MSNKVLKIFFILVLAIFAVFVLRFVFGGPEDTWLCSNGQWVKHGSPSALKPTELCGEKQATNFEECVAAGHPILEIYPRRCQMPNGETFTEEIGNELDKMDLIKIDNPRPNQAIFSPLTIQGQARGYWFFEGDFPFKLFDDNNKLLVSGIAQAQGEWMTEDFVPFEAELEFEMPLAEKGWLVLEKDNPSDLPENADELRLPILFEKDLMPIEIYFGTPETAGPPDYDCQEVTPVVRQIKTTKAVALAALLELLKGPTAKEKEGGFITSINSDVAIQELSIIDGVARVDFNDQLEAGVGGSCRVGAIRAQITETLKQFSSVDEVIISVDGRVEDILQP